MKCEDKAESVGHIPSGLFIVTAKGSDGVIDGFLASWVQQVSFEPMMISLAVKPGRPAYETITSGSTFTINVVGENDKNFMKHFWGGYDPKKNPFDEEVKWETGENGGILITAARSAIECKLAQSVKPGDHELVIGEVLSSYTFDQDTKSTVHMRKSGKDY